MITRRNTFRLLLAPLLAPFACLLPKCAKGEALPLPDADSSKWRDRAAYIVGTKAENNVEAYPIPFMRVVNGFESKTMCFGEGPRGFVWVARNKHLTKKLNFNFDPREWHELLGWEPHPETGEKWAVLGYPIGMLEKGYRG